MLFLAKCRPISVRSGDAFHEIRPRAEAANLSAHSASPIQDAVLKRLSLLEDIVYRQLNGKDTRESPRSSSRACRAPVTPWGPARGAGGAGTFWLPQAPSYPFCSVWARRLGLLERMTCFFCAPAVSLLLLWKHVSTAGARVRESLPGDSSPSAETSRAAKWDWRRRPADLEEIALAAQRLRGSDREGHERAEMSAKSRPQVWR